MPRSRVGLGHGATLARWPAPSLEAITIELRELETVAARLDDLTEHEHLELYPQIMAVRESLRALTEELERRA